jgi:hypothetical protein
MRGSSRNRCTSGDRHPAVADAAQHRDGGQPHVLVLVPHHGQQRVDGPRAHVHQDLPDLVADAPAQRAVLEGLHQRAHRLGPDAHQGVGGGQLQGALAAGQHPDQGLHRPRVAHVAQAVHRLQHHLLGAVGQGGAQGLHRRRPTDAAQGHHRALAHVLVGVLHGLAQRRHGALVPQLAELVRGVAAHGDVRAAQARDPPFEVSVLGGVGHGAARPPDGILDNFWEGSKVSSA